MWQNHCAYIQPQNTNSKCFTSNHLSIQDFTYNNTMLFNRYIFFTQYYYGESGQEKLLSVQLWLCKTPVITQLLHSSKHNYFHHQKAGNIALHHTKLKTKTNPNVLKKIHAYGIISCKFLIDYHLPEFCLYRQINTQMLKRTRIHYITKHHNI